MPALNFFDLAAQFCRAAGTQMPAIEPDHEGALAFTARLRGVDFTVTQHPASSPDHAYVLVAFGTLPEGRELQAARQLLHSNLLMLHAQGPAFSLNPGDNQVMLQHVCALAEASGHGLLAGMASAAESALQWRAGFFLETEPVNCPGMLAVERQAFA